MGDTENKSEIKCLYIRLPFKIKDEQQVKDLHPDIIRVRLRRKDKFRFCHIVFETHEKCINALRKLRRLKIEGKKVCVKLPGTGAKKNKINFVKEKSSSQSDRIVIKMVWSSNNFIGAPNSGFLKAPSSDDEIELYISEVDTDGVDDSTFYITDEEVYDVDDTSYVDDTYDEDDYYFSDGDDDVDDDDYVDEDEIEVDETDTDSDDTERDRREPAARTNEEATVEKTNTATTATQQIDPNTDSKNNG